MKYLKYISLIVIGLIILQTNATSQCSTLTEPLFLQAPDSICAEQQTLIIKASKVSGSGVKYFWKTPVDSIITTDSILRIEKPTARYSGDYFVAIIRDTCQSAFLGPIHVQVVGIEKTQADTVKTVMACDGTQTTLTSIYKTNEKTFGQWLGTEGVVFEKPNAPETIVKGLKVGENVAIWVLSTAICPLFKKDTFLIQREIAPVLQTDGVTLKAGESSAILHLGQVSGSNLNLIKEVAITITKSARNGTLELLNGEKRLKYNRGADFQGRDAFELKVCNLRCPNLCSAPIAYTIDVFFDEKYPNVKMPKILAPKDIGEAQMFRIEKVEDYPENELLILNRWGAALAKFTNYKNQAAWGGFIKGDLPPSGAYYYKFQAKDPKGKPLKPLTSIFYIIY